ncbi:MAG TPA: VOC family protein [Gemmatimonadales bacterium]|nr:VOC family protein [Gemmatimonadales bacterium]
MQKITPFLWYDGNIAEVMEFYRSVFPGGKVVDTMPGPGGSLMGATFELDGQRFMAFNGGPHYKLTPAVSMYVSCETQAEVDALWAKLTDGGAESECGWLVDRFGLSWQIIPSILPRLLSDPDREKADRAMKAMFGMKKIDIAALERAANGR